MEISVRHTFKDIIGTSCDADFDVIQIICETLPDDAKVLEVGSLFGKSAVGFAECLEEKGGIITTIDMFLGITNAGPHPEDADDAFFEWLSQIACDAEEHKKRFDKYTKGWSNIHSVQTFFDPQTYQLNEKIDLFYWSGLHDFDSTYNGIRWAYDNVKDGGYICIAAGTNHVESYRAVTTLAEERMLSVVNPTGSTISIMIKNKQGWKLKNL